MIKRIILATLLLATVGFLVHFSKGWLQTSSVISVEKQGTLAKETTEPLPDYKEKVTKPTKQYILKEGATKTSGEYDNADSYMSVEYETGQIIQEKNSDKRVAIASITKVMTAMVTLDLVTEDEVFEVSENAADQIPSKIGAQPGEKYTVNELIQALLISSANDAAQVLQEGIDQKYGQGSLIKAMNRKAEILGLKDSHFDNPQGSDSDTDQNYSTARDVAMMSYYAVENYPLIKETVKKTSEKLPETPTHALVGLQNYNPLMELYPEAQGVKIGNTDDAGKTVSMLVERENKKILAVLLGAPHANHRDVWTAELLDDGYQKLTNLKPINVTQSQVHNVYLRWGF